MQVVNVLLNTYVQLLEGSGSYYEGRSSTIVSMYLWCEHSATIVRYKGVDICTIAHVDLIEACLLNFLHILLLQCAHNSRVQAGPLHQVAGCVKHQLYCSIADGYILTYDSC